MKYFGIVMSIAYCLASCANSSNNSVLYKSCDRQMNDHREALAEELFEKQEIKKLIELLKPCADSGDPYYQFGLGMIYYNNHAMELIGEEVDKELAFKWFVKAAEKGYEDAISILMDAYESGDMGLIKDESMYLHWKQKLEKN